MLVMLNLTLGSSIGGRRLANLFGFNVPTSLGELQSQAGAYVSTAGSQITAAAAGAAGLPSIVMVLTESQALLSKGMEVLQAAWASFVQFSAQLSQIFTTFKPLQETFASPTGLATLLSSSTQMGSLVTVVQQLLGTSGVLGALSKACRSTVDIFNNMSSTFSSAMKKSQRRPTFAGR